MNETTYSQLRAKLASYCDEVTSTREPVIVHRRGSEDVALVAAAELRSLIETAHLVRSPKNAQRLLTALLRVTRNETPASRVADLRREMGLGEAS